MDVKGHAPMEVVDAFQALRRIMARVELTSSRRLECKDALPIGGWWREDFLLFFFYYPGGGIFGFHPSTGKASETRGETTFFYTREGEIALATLEDLGLLAEIAERGPPAGALGGPRWN